MVEPPPPKGKLKPTPPPPTLPPLPPYAPPPTPTLIGEAAEYVGGPSSMASARTVDPSGIVMLASSRRRWPVSTSIRRRSPTIEYAAEVLTPGGWTAGVYGNEVPAHPPITNDVTATSTSSICFIMCPPASILPTGHRLRPSPVARSAAGVAARPSRPARRQRHLPSPRRPRTFPPLL